MNRKQEAWNEAHQNKNGGSAHKTKSFNDTETRKKTNRHLFGVKNLEKQRKYL